MAGGYRRCGCRPEETTLVVAGRWKQVASVLVFFSLFKIATGFAFLKMFVMWVWLVQVGVVSLYGVSLKGFYGLLVLDLCWENTH